MYNTSLADIEAIIFDLGGTIFSLPLPLFDYHRKFLREVSGHDFKVSDEVLEAAHDIAEKEVGENLVQSNVGAHYSLTTEDWVKFDTALLRELGVTEKLEEKGKQYQRLWDELLTAKPVVLNSCAKEVLEELNSRGYKLGVATNWDDPSDILDNLGVLHLFQSIQWTFVDGYTKPSPYLLIMNARDLGVNPLKCAVVGDNIGKDVIAAKRAGMKPILLIQSSNERQIDDDILVIEDLKELLHIFEKLK